MNVNKEKEHGEEDSWQNVQITILPTVTKFEHLTLFYSSTPLQLVQDV
jgi:hypothetical protein